MKTFFKFINAFIFRVCFDLLYVLIGVLLIKILIDAGLFLSRQFFFTFSGVVLFYLPYQELTNELIIKLFNLYVSSEAEESEDKEQ